MKRSTGNVYLGFALALLVAAPAAAKPPSNQRPREEVVVPAKTHYEFDDDLVEGGLQNPDGTIVGTHLPAKHSSLIKLRDDFLPELVKSAENN